MRIVVYGTPAPQGSKKIGSAGRHGAGARAILVESSKKVAPWREAVKWAVIRVRGGNPPLDGPLVLRIVFTLAKPQSAPKKRTTYPDRKPDLDKLLRSTMDALVQGGAIADDARAVEFERVAKVFPSEDVDALEVPGAVIEIRSAIRSADADSE
jgi:Holliday junction resolvase RusA-like endonuclease